MTDLRLVGTNGLDFTDQQWYADTLAWWGTLPAAERLELKRDKRYRLITAAKCPAKIRLGVLKVIHEKRKSLAKIGDE
jgi:hypothetical protein